MSEHIILLHLYQAQLGGVQKSYVVREKKAIKLLAPELFF